jgi:hypothetical protein
VAYYHEFVEIPARLAGMDRQAMCGVFAQKVSLPGTELYNYARAVVVDAPANLPDGIYSVTFDERTFKVQRLDGEWIALVT